MVGNPIKVSLSLPIELEVSTAFLVYCAGLDPARDWDMGGVSGYNDRSNDLDLSKLHELTGNEDESLNLGNNEVMKFAVQLFHEHWTGEKIIKKHFPNHTFYFVIGAERTGGTFLLTQLYKATGIDHRTLNRWMLRDMVPRGRNITPTPAYPNANLMGIFELCQFLAWAKFAVDSDVVVLKNILFVTWMHVLNPIFEDQAKYAVTVRHPIPYVASLLQWSGEYDSWEEFISLPLGQTGLPSHPAYDDPDFAVYADSNFASTYPNAEDVSPVDILLSNWEMRYLDAVHHKPAGEFIVFEYGDPKVDFFQDRYPEYLQECPDGLEWRKDTRDYDEFCAKYGIDIEETQQRVNKVQDYWKNRGYEFPDISLS